MSTPAPHQQRVIDERIDLDVKIHALDKFITSNTLFDGLPVAEQTRMQLQLMAMRLYSHILGDRIAAF